MAHFAADRRSTGINYRIVPASAARQALRALTKFGPLTVGHCSVICTRASNGPPTLYELLDGKLKIDRGAPASTWSGHIAASSITDVFNAEALSNPGVQRFLKLLDEIFSPEFAAPNTYVFTNTKQTNNRS